MSCLVLTLLPALNAASNVTAKPSRKPLLRSTVQANTLIELAVVRQPQTPPVGPTLISQHPLSKASHQESLLGTSPTSCVGGAMVSTVMATVLPHLMIEFKISFVMGSLFYVASTMGFLIGTLLLERIIRIFGQARRDRTQSAWYPNLASFIKCAEKSPVRFSATQATHLVVSLGSVLHGLFFLIMGLRGGFPALFIAHMVAAFSRALMSGCLNPHFSIVPKHLGYSYAFWSFGGVVSPLVCQAVMARGVPWWHFYLGTLVASALNSCLLATSFQPTRIEYTSEVTIVARSSYLETASTKFEDDATVAKPPTHLRLALQRPILWAIAIFSGLYFASETTSQGFMVSFLLEIRSGNPKTTGYVTSGFWAGIMLGRLGWGYLTPIMGAAMRKYAVGICLCTMIGLSMHFIIWFVSSVPIGGSALAIIGLLYGPVFPACLTLANELLPEEFKMVSMAIISCFASIGCAILFLVAGVIVNNTGIVTLPYINVTLTGILIVYWLSLPIRKQALNVAFSAGDQGTPEPKSSSV